ncbi:hypothetical protein Ana3638_08170 [Anaerocolumna sedimenticola]|uniref:Uncharacterized protein n=1 Tax=Anaerocolumna sedimenticola TaxID=2696063 RepID=A0A6P1THQ8_9FIRM|nr:hypothetical protein [Anaerocolumna sedimenticola]QHQ60750.1 hypothetical protein Ana3638_08170 [Anaerocolumna sedimenticola]
MNNKTSNKKSAGKGNGNSVINNTERARNNVSGDSTSKNKAGGNTQK